MLLFYILPRPELLFSNVNLRILMDTHRYTRDEVCNNIKFIVSFLDHKCNLRGNVQFFTTKLRFATTKLHF